MEENKISELMDVTMTKVKELVDTNTIVGAPITTPDGITVIPVSRVSFGFGSGGTGNVGSKAKGYMGGGGAGVRVDPVGFLIIKDGACRMVNVAAPALTTMDRVIGMAPDILDKVEAMIDKYSGTKV